MHNRAYQKIFAAVLIVGLGALFTIGCASGNHAVRPSQPEAPEGPPPLGITALKTHNV